MSKLVFITNPRLEILYMVVCSNITFPCSMDRCICEQPSLEKFSICLWSNIIPILFILIHLMRINTL